MVELLRNWTDNEKDHLFKICSPLKHVKESLAKISIQLSSAINEYRVMDRDNVYPRHLVACIP